MPKSLTVFSRGGLTSRLRVLVSGRVLARAAGWDLHVLWPLLADCMCPYERLFEGAADVQTVPAEVVRGRPEVSGLATPPDLLLDHGRDLVLGSDTWLLRPDKFPAHRRLHPELVVELDALVPTLAIRERLADATRDFRPFMIGVHLRRGDFHTARPHAVANTEDAMNLIAHHLERVPGAGIFLCTDDGASAGGRPMTEGVRDILRRRFGDRVTSIATRSVDRAQPEAYEDALVDLLALRRTHLVIGTGTSSFSQLGAFGRGVPFERAHATPARIARAEQVMQRLGLRPLFMAAARIQLGREPRSFYLAWRALADSDAGRQLKRVRAFAGRPWRRLREDP